LLDTGSCYAIPVRAEFPRISPPSIPLYLPIWYKNLFHLLTGDQSRAIQTPALLCCDHREAAADLGKKVLEFSLPGERHRCLQETL